MNSCYILNVEVFSHKILTRTPLQFPFSPLMKLHCLYLDYFCLLNVKILAFLFFLIVKDSMVLQIYFYSSVLMKKIIFPSSYRIIKPVLMISTEYF